MITENDILKFELNVSDIELVKRESLKACLGGHSSVFNSSEQRKDRLLFDQVTGQLGDLTINVFVHGKDYGKQMYQNLRNIRNQNKWAGDDGRDVLGMDLDIKTSCILNDDFNILFTRLAVRPSEFRKDWVYVLGIVYEKEKLDSSVIINLVGWARSSDFPKEVMNRGKFAGAYIITAVNLRCMKDLDNQELTNLY